MESADFTYASRSDPAWKRALIGAVETASGRNHIRELYLAHQQGGWNQKSFFATAVKALSLDLRYQSDRLARWPAHAPLLVIANHPFGVLDGIILASLVETVRSDFLALTNAVLLRAPEMAGRMLPIDFAENRGARRGNAHSRQKAVEHLQGGGCLILFPAGAMATAPDFFGAQPAVERAWTPYLARLIQAAQCPVAPVYFHGQNSRAFQIASHIHLNLRLALFFHEVRRRIGTPFPIEIGEVVGFDELGGYSDRAGLVAALRERTLGLAQPRPR